MNQQQTFYLASALENAQEVQHLRLLLEEAGYRCSYDWTQHGRVQHLGWDVVQNIALQELGGVQGADFVVVLMPGGRGTHMEFGAALTSPRCKRVFLVAEHELLYDQRVTCFYHHPLVTWINREGTSHEWRWALLAEIADFFQPVEEEIE